MESNVPYVKQPANSAWCGASCAAMLLKFHKKRISQERIARELPIRRRGVTIPRLAYYFLRQEMSTTLQAWPPGMSAMVRSKGPIGGEKAIAKLTRGIRESTSHRARVLCKELIPFVKRGGQVLLRPITIDDLRGRLEDGSPLIINIDASHFTGDRRQFGHYVVAYGITSLDSQVSEPYLNVHDPSLGAERFRTVRKMLAACNEWYGAAIYITPT